MTVVFIILFLLFAAGNLWANFKENVRLANLTKPFLMLLLMGLLLSLVKTPNAFVVAGLIFGLAGDILLISKKSERLFMAGLVSFLLGHVCYIVAMFIKSAGFSPAFAVLSFAALAVVGVLSYLSLAKKIPSEMKIPVIIYLAMLVFLNYVAVNILAGAFSFAALLLFIGTASFYVSDYILARGRFSERLKKQEFVVMTTYIAAQVLIAAALIA